MRPRPVVWPRTLAATLLMLVVTLAGCIGPATPDPADTDAATTDAATSDAARDLVDADPGPLPQPPPEPVLLVERIDPDDPLRIRADLGWTGPGTIEEWNLHFGDTTRTRTGNGTPPETLTHRYRAPGTYIVTYTLWGEEGRRTTDATVTVHAPPAPLPTLTLGADRHDGPVPLDIVFRPESATRGDRALYWTLDPGDGHEPYGGLGLPSPTLEHRYTTIGAHEARLTLVRTDGIEQNTTTTVHVRPPDGTTVWTLHHDHDDLVATPTGNASAHDITLDATCPGCTPRALATTPGRIHLALDTYDGNGTLVTLESGNHSAQTTHALSPGPRALHTHPSGDVWVTYDDHDHVHRLAADGRRIETYETHPLGGGAKQIGFSPDGRTVWVADDSDPGLLLGLDTRDRSTTLLRMPTAFPATTIQETTLHGMVIVQTTSGTAHILARTTTGPAHRAIMDPGLGDDPRPVGLTCRPQRDHCWTAYANATLDGHDAHGVLVRFKATDGAVTHMVPLGPDETPTGLHLDGDRHFLGLQDENGTRLVLLDDEGRRTHDIPVTPPDARTVDGEHATTDTTGTPPTPFVVLPDPAWPAVVYTTDPTTGGWATVDLGGHRTVRHSVSGHGAAVGLAIG